MTAREFAIWLAAVARFACFITACVSAFDGEWTKGIFFLLVGVII